MTISTSPERTQGNAVSVPSRRSDGTRARLLAAAIETFSAKGFHGTSTRDIARAANISPAAMYAHHRSKEELLYLIARTGHEDACAVVQQALATSTDPVTQLRQVMYDCAIYHARSHVMARVVNYELAALAPEHLEEILEHRRRITDLLRAMVDAGIASGAFDPPDPTLAVAALLSLTVDIARWYRDDGLAPDRVATAYAEMAYRFVGPGQHPPTGHGSSRDGLGPHIAP